MSLTRELETWAIALHLERTCGEGTPAFIASRVGELAAKGDMAGITRWTEIATTYDKLLAGGREN